MLKYLFMGTPPFAATILEKLCDGLHPPAAVITQLAKAQGRGHKIQTSAVEAYAKTQDLNVMETADVNMPGTVDVLKTFQPDIVVVAAFGQILRNEILTLPKLFCLNVHGSLLPRYRGAAPVQRAIWDGEAKTGITIQKMARKLDTGDILHKKEIAIAPNDTSATLMEKLAILGGEALLESIRMIESGNYSFTPQIEADATYAKKIEKDDGRIDWTQNATRIERQVRALQPWPVAESTFAAVEDQQSLRFKIFECEVKERQGSPGEIESDGKSTLVVQCGDKTALSLTVIQPDNKKRIDVKSFLNSFRGRFPYRKMDGC